MPDFDLAKNLEHHETKLKQFMPDNESEANGDTLSFPDIMAGAAGDFAKLYASYLEVPAHFFFISYLTCLGAAISGNLTLATEIQPQPRLFTILLGESADDRKSTGIAKTVDLFRETLTEFNVSFGVGSAEGLQERIKSETDEPSRLLLCFDEFKSFVSKCRIDASVLLPCVNTLYESNRYESRTKNSSIVIHNAHLALLAASTTETYERCWESSFTDIGFNNRLFLVPGSGKKRFSLPAKVPELEKRAVQNRLGDLLRFVGAWKELDITQDGRELYHSWYMSLEKSVHAKRLDVYALRFMALLAINQKKKIVDADIVNKATRLMDWQLSVRRLHDPIDSDSLIGKTEERIRRLLQAGPKKEWELKRLVHVDRTGLWPFMQALRNLQAGREIKWNKVTKNYEFLKGES